MCGLTGWPLGLGGSSPIQTPVFCQPPLHQRRSIALSSNDNLYLPSGRSFETQSIESWQSLKSLVPSRVTLKADTMHSAFCPSPRRTPDILTGSLVNGIILPFSCERPFLTPLGWRPECREHVVNIRSWFKNSLRNRSK